MSNISTPASTQQKKHRIQVGEVYGRWTVVQLGTTVNHQCKHLCDCTCGTQRWVSSCNLRSGASANCGCVARAATVKRNQERAAAGLLCPKPRVTHGECGRGARSSEHRSWTSMRNRCFYEKSIGYPRYGGRGITVCSHWKNSYENFLADMGRKPTSKHTIDRIDVNGSYTCGKCEQCKQNGWTANCRWADQKTQQNNRTVSKMLEFNGKRQSMAMWAEELGISKQTLKARLGKYEWNVERALTTDAKDRWPTWEYAGKSQNLKEWGDEIGIDPSTLWRRLNKLGWSIERALTTPVRGGGKS